MNANPNPAARPTSLILLLALVALSASAADTFVYFGTHRSGPGIGFSLAHFDTDTGALTKPQFITEAVEPAYFVIHPDGRHLYTCNSSKTTGAISAYVIDPKTGRLTLLNQKPSGGADPSYITLDKTGHYALVANYQGGNISVLTINPDYTLGAKTAFEQHTGRSVDPERQTRPFAHSIVVDPSNRFALVADLGLDKVFVYRFNEQDGSLTPNDPPFATVKPGSGPRHVKFDSNGKWVYVINEMGCTVTGFKWNAEKGSLKEFQTISTLPEGFKGTNTCAELLIHPNGRFLYGSNRGNDSIAVFAINQKNGKLTLVERVASQGKWPRNFTFDPTGKWILCSNHNSDNAVVFRVDGATGKLTQVGQPVAVPFPFCTRFLPVP
ncbi:MAG: lactonase family protein [Verrucomicrobiota bacterium]|jgi:6-phosphogluconolactonase